MKKILLILLCFPLIVLAQKTYVPDDNLEQALINLGHDNVLDDFVLTSNISKVTELIIPSMDIVDLTGVQDFISLEKINCTNNRIRRINISQNINLRILLCSNNQIANLYLAENLELTNLVCKNNKLTSLDMRQNSKLTGLDCSSNKITSLHLKDPTKTHLKKDVETVIYSDADEKVPTNKLYTILNLRINTKPLDLSKRFIVYCHCRNDLEVRDMVETKLVNALLSKGFTVSKNTINLIGDLAIDPGYEFIITDSKKITITDQANKEEMGTIIISPKSQRFMGYFSGRNDTHLNPVEFIIDTFFNTVTKN
jgi:Leucine-rich repeat (LRR) protein